MTEPRTLPSNLHAERALIGAVLVENDVYRLIEDVVQPTDFLEPIHQRLFEAIVAAIRGGRLADPIILQGQFADDEAMQSLGGRYVLDLVDRAPPSRNAPTYAQAVADTSGRRELIRLAERLDEQARAADGTAPDLIVSTERDLAHLAANGPTQSRFHTVTAVYERQFQRSRDSNGAPPGHPTGLRELDAITGGLRDATVNVFAGRPGMGKSAFGVQLAINLARRGLGVAFFSLEMPEEQVGVRFGTSLAFDRSLPLYAGKTANPHMDAFEKGELDEAQWRALRQAGDELRDLPIELDFRAALRPSQILAASRRKVREWDKRGIRCGAVIVDHFLKIAGDPKEKDQVTRYTQNSNAMLDGAKALGVPVVLLAQLNRGVEAREDKRPGLSDLKFTGALEEDAFGVTMLYRPDYYNRPPEKEDDDKAWSKHQALKTKYARKLLFLVEKNRGGRAPAQVEAFCDIGCNAIADLEQRDDTAGLQFPIDDEGYGDMAR